MGVEEIIEELDRLAKRHEMCLRCPSLKPLASAYRRTARVLRAAIEKLETHQETQPNEPQGDGWISAKNPPDLGGGHYLVWTDNNGTEICRWSEGRKRWIGGAWTLHITHWRPMPEPPKAEKQDVEEVSTK